MKTFFKYRSLVTVSNCSRTNFRTVQEHEVCFVQAVSANTADRHVPTPHPMIVDRFGVDFLHCHRSRLAFALLGTLLLVSCPLEPIVLCTQALFSISGWSSTLLFEKRLRKSESILLNVALYSASYFVHIKSVFLADATMHACLLHLCCQSIIPFLLCNAVDKLHAQKWPTSMCLNS